ncbi:hypothetical protein G7Z17_g5196 [Cylindrodendrum hubeiense]|uniref:Peptidase A1 domain-containing protein n=1 Tax=Cylindrodendrum hubeiense TaxID=595255 RepID=A0A9P5HHJ9_9HYPO|nr:hypothetical protein G7Z17_g5196 [Cylindrodendrum hubeiense]
MKLSLIALTVAQLGSCVDASSSCSSKRSTREEVVEGYWEEDAPPSHFTRSNPNGKKFKLKQVINNNYHGLGAPMEMARAYAKYNKTPPPAVKQAVEGFVPPSVKASSPSGKFGTAQSLPTKYYDSEYVVPVKLGTPAQLTYLNLDTGSADLWTFSTDTPKSSSAGHILYRPRLSSTSKFQKGVTWGLTYGDGSGASGIVYTDRVAIGATFANTQAVQSATQVSSSIAEDTFSSGIMGMAFSTINSVRPTQQMTYFENIQNTLAQPIFTSNLQKGLPGTYNFGYVDKNEYKGSIYYNPINSNSPFWQITLTGYKVGKNPYKKFNWLSIVDTGTTLLLAPTTIVNAYYAKVKGAKMDKSMGVMLFPCAAKLPDFYFGLGPYRGKVPGAYMSYGPRIPNMSDLGSTRASPQPEAGGEATLFLSDQPLLQLSIANLQALDRLHNPSQKMTDSVLVLGAGELGLGMLEALARHPRRHNTRISVLLRQATLDSAAPEKKKLTQRIRALGVGFEAADVVGASVSDLAAIFAHFDTIISCNGMGLPAGTQVKLLEAVVEAQVKRYFPWQFGMDYDLIGEGSSQDLFDEQLEVRKGLRAQSQVDWVIVSTGLFMSFLFLADFGVVDLEARTVRALGSWDNRITLSTPGDIGRVTADVVLDPQGIKSQVAYTAGDTISYGGLADLLDQHFQTQFRRELWDAAELQRQMDEDPNTMVKYRDTFAQGRGVAWDKEKTVNFQRGIAMTDVKTYLEGMQVKLGE